MNAPNDPTLEEQESRDRELMRKAGTEAEHDRLRLEAHRGRVHCGWRWCTWCSASHPSREVALERERLATFVEGFVRETVVRHTRARLTPFHAGDVELLGKMLADEMRAGAPPRRPEPAIASAALRLPPGAKP